MKLVAQNTDLRASLRVRDGEEPHQDVRQPGGAEHQRHARARSPRPDRSTQCARAAMIALCFGDYLHRLGEQRLGIEAEREQHHEGHEARAAEQQRGLDDLHPGGGGHAAEHT